MTPKDTTLPTVTIVDPNNPKDFIVINETDYDPRVHKLWKSAKKPAAEG